MDCLATGGVQGCRLGLVGRWTKGETKEAPIMSYRFSSTFHPLAGLNLQTSH